MDVLTQHCCLWLCVKEICYLQLPRTLPRAEISSPAPAKVSQQPSYGPFLSPGINSNLVPASPETTSLDNFKYSLSWWQTPASGVDDNAVVSFDLFCVHIFNSLTVG